MLRALLLVALLLGFTPLFVTNATHGDLAWRRDTVVVEDHTSEALGPYVEIITHNWNAALGGGMRLKYQRHPPVTNCQGVRPVEGRIVVCDYRQADAPPKVGVGVTDTWTCSRDNGDNPRLCQAFVRLVADDWRGGAGTAYWWHPLGCHELGHAIGLDHRYTETDSCLGTQLQTPGSHDAAQLKRMYGGNGGVVADPPMLCCGPVETVQTEVQAESTTSKAHKTPQKKGRR
jgi:hypothetical protein